MTRSHRRLSLLLALSTPLLIWAADVTLPHVFQAGGPIVADEVNANFATLRDAVNSKADKSSVVTSGTRLKRLGYRMADGTTEDATVTLFSGGGPSHVYFDTVDNRHCFTLSGLLDNAGKSRCFPFAGFRVVQPYTDPQCTSRITLITAATFPTSNPEILGETMTAADAVLAVDNYTTPNTLHYYQVGPVHSAPVYTLPRET